MLFHFTFSNRILSQFYDILEESWFTEFLKSHLCVFIYVVVINFCVLWCRSWFYFHKAILLHQFHFHPAVFHSATCFIHEMSIPGCCCELCHLFFCTMSSCSVLINLMANKTVLPTFWSAEFWNYCLFLFSDDSVEYKSRYAAEGFCGCYRINDFKK